MPNFRWLVKSSLTLKDRFPISGPSFYQTFFTLSSDLFRLVTNKERNRSKIVPCSQKGMSLYQISCSLSRDVFRLVAFSKRISQ